MFSKYLLRIQENLNENKQENSLSKHKDDDQNVKNALINDAEKNDIFDFFPGASMTKEQNLDGNFHVFFLLFFLRLNS